MILCMLDRYGVTLEDHFQEHCVNSVAQSCLTLCDPMDCSPPGSSIHGILQARVLEWVAIPFSRGSFQPRDQTSVSCNEGRPKPHIKSIINY